MTRVPRVPATTKSPLADRLAIAGELHDLLAHRIAAIAVQAAAAGQAIDPRQTALHGPLTAIAALSTEAIGDLRRLGRLLDPGGPPAYRPQPSLAALPGLGVAVDRPALADGAIPQSVALCAYRSIELVLEDGERRDVAPPSVAVSLERQRLVVTFEFAPDGRGDRRTVARLRERLRPCAGILTTNGDRWRAHLPLEP